VVPAAALRDLGVGLQLGHERLVDGGLGVAAGVGVHQQAGGVERLQGDRLGGGGAGVGHGVLLAVVP
jgi:hypothetical protein